MYQSNAETRYQQREAELDQQRSDLEKTRPEILDYIFGTSGDQEQIYNEKELDLRQKEASSWKIYQQEKEIESPPTKSPYQFCTPDLESKMFSSVFDSTENSSSVLTSGLGSISSFSSGPSSELKMFSSVFDSTGNSSSVLTSGLGSNFNFDSDLSSISSFSSRPKFNF